MTNLIVVERQRVPDDLLAGIAHVLDGLADEVEAAVEIALDGVELVRVDVHQVGDEHGQLQPRQDDAQQAQDDGARVDGHAAAAAPHPRDPQATTARRRKKKDFFVQPPPPPPPPPCSRPQNKNDAK